MTRVDRCPRLGCGAPLHVATDGHGGTLVICDLCARNKRGICRECPAPIPDPRALRCVRCRDQHRKRQARRNEAKRWADPVWAERRRAQQREYNQRPEVKVRKAAFKRAWLAADPEYMHVAMRKYRESEKGRKAARRANRRYAHRHPDKIREHKRAYYQRNREAIRARQNARAAEERARRPRPSASERRVNPTVTYVTCAVCGGRRRIDGKRVRVITAPETFTRGTETVTVQPPAHVCDSHLRVREFVARTDPR